MWALFDSGNGSYTKAIQTLNETENTNIDVYPIGIDIEGKNSHFIHLDLADYKRMFGDNKLFDTLDKLPKPDLIIASPPCESWSNASAMSGGMLAGNRKMYRIIFLLPRKLLACLLLGVNQITKRLISIISITDNL